MDMSNFPQLTESYGNDSSRFIKAFYNMCRSHIDSVNVDVDNWRFFIKFYRLFVSWFVPLLIIFGEVGTMLCLVVLVRRRTGNAKTRMWFVALSVSDMYSLAVGLSLFYSARMAIIFPSLLKDRPSHHWDMRHNSSFSCYLLNGMVYFGLLVSTWIQVGISVLRVLSLKTTASASSKSQKRKFSVALSLCILLALVVTFLLIGFSIEFRYPSICLTYKMCVLRKDVNRYFFYVSLIIKVLLPSLILLCCSILIINHLKKFERQFSSGKNNFSSSAHAAIRKRVKQKHISYTLLGMNFTFFILTLPFEVYKIYFFYNTPTSKDHNLSLIRVIDKALNILLYTNSATNWLFYFMLGKRFRESMAALLCQRYRCDCRSLCSSFRRLSTFIRSNRRTKMTPVSAPKKVNDGKQSASPEEEGLCLAPSAPKFHCTYPAVNNAFPQFY